MRQSEGGQSLTLGCCAIGRKEKRKEGRKKGRKEGRKKGRKLEK